MQYTNRLPFYPNAAAESSTSADAFPKSFEQKTPNYPEYEHKNFQFQQTPYRAYGLPDSLTQNTQSVVRPAYGNIYGSSVLPKEVHSASLIADTGGENVYAPAYGQGSNQIMYPSAACLTSSPNFDQQASQMSYGKEQRPMQPSDGGLKFGRMQGLSEAFVAEVSASSEFIRMSSSHVPNSVVLKKKVNIPLGFVIRPLANSLKEIPEVNFGPRSKVIRCHRCRAYINPFVTWDSSTRRWICNICDLTNETPHHYLGSLDETGSRNDRYVKKELSCGSIEILAPADYMIRPPQPPTYLFLIDVSTTSVSSGFLSLICQSIKFALKAREFPRKQRSQVAIMTFDSAIHFYHLDSLRTQPHMVVVPNINDVFIPFPEGVLTNLSESEQMIQSLLDALPNMWSKQRVTETCGGSALKAGLLALKQWGGQILFFSATAPTIGDLTVQPLKTGGSAKVSGEGSSLLKPAHDKYFELATEMTQAQIAVNMFICNATNVPMDLPTFHQLPKHTAGELRFYPNFHAMTCGDKLREEICHTLTRNTGWEAVMRVRVSRGWKITNWYGLFYFRNLDLLVLPNCHVDQNFTVGIDFEDQNVHNPFLYVQAALLYTNSEGERRIRIHTLGVPVVQSPVDVLNSADEVVIAAFLAQEAIRQAMQTNLADAKRFLQASCGQIYNSYQHNLLNNTGVAGVYAGKQEPSTMIPYYTLSLLKSLLFRDMHGVTPDTRITSWLRFMSLPLEDIQALLLPRLFALHVMPENAGTLDSSQKIILPPLVALSGVHLSQTGVYLIEDGEIMLLWIGKAVSPQWIQDVFGVDSVDYLHPEHADTAIGTTGTDAGMRVAAIIDSVRSSRLPFMKLCVIRQGMPLETRFFCLMIEDRSPALNMTYAEFIQAITSTRPGMSVQRQPQQTMPAKNKQYTLGQEQQQRPTIPSQSYLAPQMYSSYEHPVSKSQSQQSAHQSKQQSPLQQQMQYPQGAVSSQVTRPHPQAAYFMTQKQTHVTQPQPHMNQPQPHMNQPQPQMNQLQPHMNQLQPHMNQLQPHMNQLQAHMNQLQPHMAHPQTQVAHPQTQMARLQSQSAHPQTQSSHPQAQLTQPHPQVMQTQAQQAYWS